MVLSAEYFSELRPCFGENRYLTYANDISLRIIERSHGVVNFFS